jgi:ubiquinol-cytochrome c reductase cytochrome b subunit
MISAFLRAIDDRLGSAHFVSKALRKAFPDHWSFMLGEINVYAFLVLLATGTFLAFNFVPSSADTVYRGSYAPLVGTTVSEAYRSAMRLSFDINLGLLVRQVHHWAALIFLAAIVVHMGRIFFTGAFRKPRDINWLVGALLFALAILEGFSGYSLPDDLLSGIGLRIADSVVLSIPLIGTWLSYLLAGGAFPTSELIPRLFVLHVYLLPLAIAGAIGLHVGMVWRQKHTQFPGPGRREGNVIGSPLVPQYAAKSMGLLAFVAAVCVGLGTFVQINPIWIYGPYDAWDGLNPAQPDWFVGWLDGALRIGPPFALHIGPHLIPSPFWVAVLLPLVLFAILFGWPWIERLFTRDDREHHLLDLPREVPLRTSIGVAVMIFVFGLTLAGSGDIQARYIHLPVDGITIFYRWFCVVGPLIGFAISYAICTELRASGGVRIAPRVRLRRNSSGGFDEEQIS